MTTRLPLIALVGALATTTGFSADRYAAGSPSADAQTQAGNLLRAEATSPPARDSTFRAGPDARTSDRGSAQVQAANLLRGMTPATGTVPASPMARRQAQTPVDEGPSTRATIAGKSAVPPDVQVQAQRLLMAAHSRTNPTRVDR